MGWLSKLFGTSDSSGAEQGSKKGPSTEHDGYLITAMPESRGGQFQTVGEIRASNPEDERLHRFIRADVHPSYEQACEHALSKGKQIIDERGESVLDSAH